MQWIEIIYLVIIITIAILAMYLSVLIIAGKYKAKRRIGVSVLLGIIIVLIIPYLSMILDQIPVYIPPNMTPLFSGLGPYVAFLILIFLVYWLMDLAEWEKSVLIAFLTILFIVITNNVIVGITGINPLVNPF